MAGNFTAISLVISGLAISVSGTSLLIVSAGQNASYWTFAVGASLIAADSLISAVGGFLGGQQSTRLSTTTPIAP